MHLLQALNRPIIEFISLTIYVMELYCQINNLSGESPVGETSSYQILSVQTLALGNLTGSTPMAIPMTLNDPYLKSFTYCKTFEMEFFSNS